MIRSVLTILAASTILTACAADVAPGELTETVDEAASEITGASACTTGAALCWKWSGQGYAYGVCSRGVCCTGCIDARGACYAGYSEPACGRSGALCQDCDDENACTSDSCITGLCNSQRMSDGAVCGMFPLLTCADGVCH